MVVNASVTAVTATATASAPTPAIIIYYPDPGAGVKAGTYRRSRLNTGARHRQ